jgi:hypothetical protein
VIRDVNGNGSYEPALEVGVAGIPVKVTAPDGVTAAGMTGADGTVKVATASLAGGKYRIEATIPDSMSPLQPAPVGNGLSSLTEFADVSGGKNVALTMGVWNPSDYCQANPTLVTACQRNAINSTVPKDPNARSLVTFPFTARGAAPGPTQLEDQGSVGTVYGLAYRKEDKRIFSGAFAKRGTAYGPGGPGAVYATTPGGVTTVFAVVPNAGTTAHELTIDSAFFSVAGTQSLGDVDISEDGSELYVVNLNDKKLYVYNATGATGGTPKGAYAIPNPGCPSAGDWRPGALGVRDGTVYVGGVCSGQSTQQLSDVKAVVYTFRGDVLNPTPALTQTLGFVRGAVYGGFPTGNHWNAWANTWADTAKLNASHFVYPQPLLTDIGVEKNGDLVLGFRDRYGDTTGAAMPAPDGSGGRYQSASGGDLNRACRQANGKYSWEGTGTCPNNANGSNGGGQQPDVVEYYPGDHLTTVHQETAQGAIAVVPGEQRMPSTVMDPLAISTGGVGWFDRDNGLVGSNAFQISTSGSEGWGKSNGLADLEALCDLAPVQIGNRVWFDTNADGVQDGGEPPLPGVKVSLLPCAGGAAVASKTTDAKGEYYFGTADGVQANSCYTVKFDYSTANTAGIPGKPPVSLLGWSSKETGENRCIDSNVDSTTGETQIKVGKAGFVDHCVDAGVRQLNKLGDFVWADTNRNGLQDEGEPGVPGVSVTVRDDSGKEVGQTKTGEDGKYLFDQLPDGKYTVCFDKSTLPEKYADWQLTKPKAGDLAKDSNADPATWCAEPVTLNAATQVDLTVDAGIVEVNQLGDFVWHDKNNNGVQDAGEPGIAGVPVTIRDDKGNTVRQMTTDADGKYLFDDLPNGTYQVCVSAATLPASMAGAGFTKQNTAPDDAKDSDVDPASGCAAPVNLGPGNRKNPTLDVGLYRQPAAGAVKPPNVAKPGDSLAFTGVPAGLLAGLGTLILSAGIGLMLLARRRNKVGPGAGH